VAGWTISTHSETRVSVNTPSNRVLHFLYHELSSVSQAYTYALHKDAFHEQLDLFRQTSVGERIAAKVTFDDGHISNYDIAFPMLADRGMTAEFFLTANWIGKRAGYMNWGQVRDMYAAGQQIGAHGWSHKLLTHCNSAELQLELVAARKLLEDELGAPVTSLSFPGGRFNKRILAACVDAGYTKMFTSIPQLTTLPVGSLTGRLNVRGDWSLSYIESLLDLEKDVLHGLERQDKLKSLIKKIVGDTLYRWIWSAANREGSSKVASADDRI
jgi:peptidoglycan/xylan/chitin deacetylase (PgdA/CDA1 family)